MTDICRSLFSKAKTLCSSMLMVTVLSTVALSMGLTACGGGGGSAGTTGAAAAGSGTGGSTGGTGGTTGGTTGTTVAVASITLNLVDSKGVATTAITTANPLTARATVKDKAGQPIPNAVVTFATGSDLTTIAPSAGRALTNASGIATVTLAVKDLATAQAQAGAADTLTAAVSVGDQAFSTATNFSLGATAISLRMVTPSTPNINLNAYDTTPIKVEVLADGVLYTAQPVSVSFSSACAASKADLPASATTINGAAQVVYRDKGCAAIDTVTASVPGAPSVTTSLVIAAPQAASIRFVSGTPTDQAIVIQGAGGNGRSETAVLTFQALDTFGQPLPNQLVNFSLNPTGVVSLQATSATTGSDGRVIVAVNSGTTPTTFRVSATLISGQTTISDTITVTTGQPVQQAFSLSAKDLNIEGFNVDNEKTTVLALLADVAGNPVADGTPVVFQTDSGAVGSAAVGGCVTLNGGCTVEFRSQAPRYIEPNTVGKRAGVATMSVSSTSARATLTDRIAVFLSASAAQVYVNNAALSSANNTLTLSSCSATSVELEVVDGNFNPMPVRSKVESVNADKATILSILPNTVPNIGPPKSYYAGDYNASAPRRWGSYHVVVFKPDSATCSDAGTQGKGVGSFGITITSPLGVPRLFTFGIRYPAP